MNNHGLRIALNRCPHGVEMVSLDYGSSGSRFAGPKCCGKWIVIKEWPTTANDLREIAEEAETFETEQPPQ